MQQFVQEAYAGPLPHPKHLREYETIYPGAAKIIFDLVQSQTKHRQRLEEAVIRTKMTNEKIGMYLSFILASGFAILGFLLIFTGKNVPLGFFTMLGPVFIQGAGFFYNKSRERQELKRKTEEVFPH